MDLQLAAGARHLLRITLSFLTYGCMNASPFGWTVGQPYRGMQAEIAGKEGIRDLLSSPVEVDGSAVKGEECIYDLEIPAVGVDGGRKMNFLSRRSSTKLPAVVPPLRATFYR